MPLGVQKGISNRRVYNGGLPYIQFSATINPGNSGGPLIDQYGRVIGIVSWKRSDAENMNYAIPYEQLDIVLRKRQTISDIQQQLIEIPIVQGEGGIYEQELNDTFDQADIIPYTQGLISGTTFDDEDVDVDVDVFSFRIDKQMKFFIAGDYGSRSAEYFYIGLYDVEGEPIQYSQPFNYEGNPLQGLSVNLSPGVYSIAVFSKEGLDSTDYQENPYQLLYQLLSDQSANILKSMEIIQQIERILHEKK